MGPIPHAAPNPVSVSLLDVLLDDVILTHSLFLPTERLLRELHQRYPSGEGPEVGGSGDGQGGPMGFTPGWVSSRLFPFHS